MWRRRGTKRGWNRRRAEGGREEVVLTTSTLLSCSPQTAGSRNFSPNPASFPSSSRAFGICKPAGRLFLSCPSQWRTKCRRQRQSALAPWHAQQGPLVGLCLCAVSLAKRWQTTKNRISKPGRATRKPFATRVSGTTRAIPTTLAKVFTRMYVNIYVHPKVVCRESPHKHTQTPKHTHILIHTHTNIHTHTQWRCGGVSGW